MGIKTTFIILHESINPAASDYWRLVQIGRKGENNILIIILTFQMPPRSKFTTDESVKIVKWWYELKDLHKVRWRYAKENGIEKFPRKLPSVKTFKCVIERFDKSGSVKIDHPKKMEKKPVTEKKENRQNGDPLAGLQP